MAYPTRMANWVRCAIVLSGVAVGVACGNHPVTWEGRHAKATTELEAAKGDLERFYALPDAAKASFEVGNVEEARGYARELLTLAPRFTDDWNHGNAIHDGHMVLGRVALREGAIETAEKELLMAGGTPGSPQLDSFGPNMSLAKDLLEQNHTDAVVEYFGLCAKFWEMERGRLRRWTVLAEAGEMPNFEANLLY